MAETTAPKREVERHNDVTTPKTEDGTDANALQLFFEERDGKFFALLPSGKRPEIRRIRPSDKLRDIIVAHPRPAVPLVDVQPEGVKIAQKFPNSQDPAYLSALAKWREVYMAAMMTRCLFDSLVVPDDDHEWAWLLELTNVPVPESGPERVRLYAQEKHPEFWDPSQPDEMAVFVAAVQQITMPTEAGINIARQRFRDKMAESAADESATSPGRLPGRSRDGGIENG